MSLTRWKLLAGVLGISLVGLVAMANPQCPSVAQKDHSRETAPTARVADPRPVPIQPTSKTKEKVATAPALTLPRAAPLDLTLPTFDALPIPSAKTVELPKIELPASRVKEISLPELPKPTPEVRLELPTFAVATPKVEAVAPKAFVVDLPLPGAPATPPLPDVAKVEFKAAPPAITFEPPTATVPAVSLPPVPVEQPKKVPAVAPVLPARKETKPADEEFTIRTSEDAQPVRVVVHLGTGQAQFSVIRGEETLLKAVSDSIEVRSPSDKGNFMAPLKAGGKVRFSAPGCEGTCDSLMVQPVSGEVELTGNVSVQCRQGKGETQMNGSSMKFKFGAVPTAVAEPKK